VYSYSSTRYMTSFCESSPRGSHLAVTAEDLSPRAFPRNNRYYVLVEFAVRHLDFQFAELHSVLNMYGISCRWERLPSDDKYPSHQSIFLTSGSRLCSTRPFVLLSLEEHSPWVPQQGRHPEGNDDACTSRKSDISTIILSRCTLVRSVLELWGMATSVEDCATRTQQWCTARTGPSCCMAYIDGSWKMTVLTLGSTYSREDQDEMRHWFTTHLNFTGPVLMQDPDNEFVIIREIQLDAHGGPFLQQQQTIENGSYPSIACYFGRALGGCRSKRRMGGNMPKYDLKQRKYLGPTSMDAELSFVMTNLGQVKAGHIVFDPFVGTGSILLSAALRGAYCVGTDIDIRVLRGRSARENIITNFQQFHLPRPELIRSDNGLYHRHFHGTNSFYDAILCDPPYGIRAGARKSGSKRKHVAEVKPENRHDHIAQTQPYAVSDVMTDLLDVAAQTLVMRGRLVYVIPSFATSFDIATDLPQHPCLELKYVCYQPFTVELGRRIVVMEKVSVYDFSKRNEYLSSAWKDGPEAADKCANIRSKILEAAKAKPSYDEKSVIRKEKRRLHREEKKQAKQMRHTTDVNTAYDTV
jgi:tRNA (guanine10-N2)-methyltransferase